MKSQMMQLMLCALALCIVGCGESQDEAPAQTGVLERAKDSQDVRSARSLRPFEGAIRIERIDDIGARLRVRLHAETPTLVASGRVWGADGAEVIATAPDIVGQQLEPGIPLTVEIDYRLTGPRGHLAVAAVTATGRRVLKSFAVGTPLPAGAEVPIVAPADPNAPDAERKPRAVRSVPARRR